MSALDVLRHVSGITRVGGAFEFTTSVLKPEHVSVYTVVVLQCFRDYEMPLLKRLFFFYLTAELMTFLKMP